MLRFFYYLILIVIAFLPKVNLISFNGTTTGIRIEDFLIVIITFFLLLLMKSRKYNNNIDRNIRNIIKLYFLYFIISVISTIFGIMNNYVGGILTILFLLRKIEYFIVLFIGYEFVKTVKDREKLLKLFDSFVFFNFIIVLLQYFGIVGASEMGKFVELSKESRLCSIFNGAYEFSAFLLLLLPKYAYELSIKQKNNIKNLIYIIMIFFCIFMSQSRTSLIIFFIILVMILLEANKKTLKKILLCFSFVFILIIILLNIKSIISFLPRFDSLNIKNMLLTLKEAWYNRDFQRYINMNGYYELVRGINVDRSFNMRISKCMTLLDGFLKSPLIGVGLSIVKISADCAYIRIITESGIFGFISYMSCLIYIYKHRNIRDKEFSIIIKYSIITLLLSGIFIDIFDSSKVIMLFWFLVGFSCKLDNILNDKKDNNICII